MSQKPIHRNSAATENESIRAEHDAAWLRGIINHDACILHFGNKMRCSKISDTKVKIESGVFALQGFCIEIPEYEEFAIEPGAGLQNRIDLIVASYIKGATKDEYQIKVVKGSQTGGVPQPPLLVANDLHGVGTACMAEIARITLKDHTITSAITTAEILGARPAQIRGTESDLDYYSVNYGIYTTYEFVFIPTLSGAQLGGTAYHVRGFKATNDYEEQMAATYHSSGGRLLKRSKLAGVWTNWVAISG